MNENSLMYEEQEPRQTQKGRCRGCRNGRGFPSISKAVGNGYAAKR